MNFSCPGLNDLLLKALSEDIASGDVTTDCCVSAESVSKGVVRAKEAGVICGLPIMSRIFALFDNKLDFNTRYTDGSRVVPGDIIAELSGSTRSILTTERTALNLLQILSGIATRTSKAVQIVSGTNAKIVDTRKTLPGLRVLSKYAVRCGGGYNHRFDLSSGVLIKDNHISAAGGITSAINAARNNSPITLKIEIETETLAQVEEAVTAGAHIIMLDNMDINTIEMAVKLINGRALCEASGNMGELHDNELRKVAETGVDFISMSAITLSAKALDISLRI